MYAVKEIFTNHLEKLFSGSYLEIINLMLVTNEQKVVGRGLGSSLAF